VFRIHSRDFKKTSAKKHLETLMTTQIPGWRPGRQQGPGRGQGLRLDRCGGQVIGQHLWEKGCIGKSLECGSGSQSCGFVLQLPGLCPVYLTDDTHRPPETQ
jgi:hypothetical protein